MVCKVLLHYIYKMDCLCIIFFPWENVFQVLNEAASNTSSTHSDLYEMTWLPHRGSHTGLPRGAGSEGDPETGKWGWVGVSAGELRGEGHHPGFGVQRVSPHLDSATTSW